MSENPTSQRPERSATFLRERLFYAAFMAIIFAATFNLVIFLTDQVVSGLRIAQVWSDYIAPVVYILASVVMGGGAGLILLVGVQSLWLAWRMEHSGAVTEGWIVEKKLAKGPRDRNYCALVYSFGNDTRIIQFVPEVVYSHFKVGDMVRVRYLPGRPEIARLETKK